MDNSELQRAMQLFAADMVYYLITHLDLDEGDVLALMESEALFYDEVNEC